MRTSTNDRSRSAVRLGLLVLLGSTLAAFSSDLALLRADRAAIERVYYNHRLGEKPPFEQALPAAMLNDLVRQDQRKEAALRNSYALEVTPSMLASEVRRIDTTTRAPGMLAEIKAALGNDPSRFAQAFARPILVERLLRDKFDNDNALHAPQRLEVEKVREKLRSARSGQGDQPSSEASVKKLLALLRQDHSNALSEITWQLGQPPAPTNTPAPGELEIKKHFGPNAQLLSRPADGAKGQDLYFEDLNPELQGVLRVQLRHPGDVSAVIETDRGFLLYLAKEKTATTLTVATLSVPKRSYDQWLNEQDDLHRLKTNR